MRRFSKDGETSPAKERGFTTLDQVSPNALRPSRQRQCSISSVESFQAKRQEHGPLERVVSRFGAGMNHKNVLAASYEL